MGFPFLSVMDVLEGAREKPDILKLGMVYPVPRDVIGDFLKAHEEIKVLEELDDEMEKEIKSLAYDLGIRSRIIGKMDQEDWIGEYTPDKVYGIIGKTWPDLAPPKKEKREAMPEVPKRPAQLCPGCGHRSAFYAIKQALRDTDITVADIGCHTLGFQPPYNLGEALMCMGASTAMGSGLSLFNNSRKVVVFLGDSTFFHAGLPGVINAVFNKHNVTLILMENGTTAMTGHQDHPASGKNFNEITDKIPVRQVLEGLGVKHIYETDTYAQSDLTGMVKQAVEDNGFSAVIARHPCMLKFTREHQRQPSYKRRWIEIDQQTCEQSYECVERFGCPTFQRKEDGRVEANRDLCIGDGSCRQTCPLEAIPMPTMEDNRVSGDP